jgi:GNAT superfamily N-acetyltransferase
MMISIQPIEKPAWEDFRPLIDASKAEGYDFVQKLWDEYQSGKATFQEPGAVLLGVYDDERLIAVGGVHSDPYLKEVSAGRIRHVYVLPEYRRGGMGKKLVQALMEYGANQFNTFTLRTMTQHGRDFYTALGFTDEPRFADATHWCDAKS